MARVGNANYMFSSGSPERQDCFWRQCMTREQWRHTFHPCNYIETSPGFQGTTTQFEAMSNTWRILEKTNKAAGRCSYAKNLSKPLSIPANVLVKPSASFSRSQKIQRSRSSAVLSARSSGSSTRRSFSSRSSRDEAADVRMVAQPDVQSFNRTMNI